MQQGPVSSLVESLFGGDSRCALAGQVPNWGSFRQRRAVVQLDLGDGRTDVSEWAGFLRRSTFCVIAVIRSNDSAAMSDLLHDVPRSQAVFSGSPDGTSWPADAYLGAQRRRLYWTSWMAEVFSFSVTKYWMMNMPK